MSNARNKNQPKPQEACGARGMSVASQLIVLALIVTGLALGRSFLVPVAIAFLATTLIAATADRISRMGLGPNAAMAASILLFVAAIGAVIFSITGQGDEVSAAWPRYVARLQTLLQDAIEQLGPKVSERVMAMVQNLDLARTIPTLMGSAGAFLASFGLVAIYVGFMLAERRTVPNKIANIVDGGHDVAHVNETVRQIVAGIRDYVWIKTIMSVLTAGVSYAVLKSLDVDFAETWVLLIFFLNYIPNIGSVLGVAFPALLALVQFDTLWQFAVIVVFLALAQFLIGNVLEPRVMGRTLNLSPFVVLASLTFWTMLWGVVGAFLSVPLTASVAIACSRIPSWRWLAVLLSEDGSLDSPPERKKA